MHTYRYAHTHALRLNIYGAWIKTHAHINIPHTHTHTI